MSKRVMICLLLALVGRMVMSADKLASTAVKAYLALEKEYAAELADFQKAYQLAGSAEEKQKVFRDKHPKPADYAPRFMALAKKYPSSLAAVDALGWIVLHPLEPTNKASGLRPRALALLQSEHIKDERLGRLCTQLVQTIDPESEEFLQTVLDKGKAEGVQARACASLAQNLKYRGRLIPRLNGDKEAVLAAEQAWGKSVVRALLKRDPAKLLARSEKFFERVAAEYGKIKHPLHGTLAGLAKANLQALRRPVTAGKPAPEVVSEDIAGKKMRLSDYRGKVVLLDFWSHAMPSCRLGYPIERALVKRLAGKPFVLLGVNADVNRKALLEQMEEEKITWKSWYDGGYPGGPIATRWDVEVWPTLFLVDAKGVVRKRFIGWTERKAIEEAIDGLVRQVGKE